MGKPLVIQILLALLLLLAGCGKEESKETASPDELLQIGDSVLTLQRVVREIPPGLSAEDSAAMFRAVVDRWVEEQLLFQLAEDNLAHLSEIEEKVAAYRKSLIVQEYRRMMAESRMGSVAEDSVRAYFERHKGEMKLGSPLVKGVYLKIDGKAEKLPQIKKWVHEASQESADKIEKYGLKNALEYDYFADRWVDWQTIADQIPYHFPSPDQFLASHQDFEYESGGSVYLLRVTGYLASGDTIPYDFAATGIREALSLEQKEEADRRLLRQLYDKGVKEKKVRVINYDPFGKSEK